MAALIAAIEAAHAEKLAVSINRWEEKREARRAQLANLGLAA